MISECSELKKVVREKKLSPVELRVFFPCFLDERHYFLFELGYSSSTKIYETKEYIIMSIQSNINETWFVTGIDDSGKYFTSVIPYPPPAAPTDDKVRSLLGFKYHKHEISKDDIQKDMSIRIQGDLILLVYEIFKNSSDIVNFLLDYGSFLVERYVHNVLAKKEGYRKIVELWENYLYFHDLSRRLKIKMRPYISFYRQQLEKELQRQGIKYEELKRRGVTLLDVPVFENELNRKFIDIDEFYQYLVETQENLEIKIGHFIRPHIVHLKGHQHWNNYYLILEPQEIEVIHPEHGKDTFYIPKPCVIYFYTE